MSHLFDTSLEIFVGCLYLFECCIHMLFLACSQLHLKVFALHSHIHVKVLRPLQSLYHVILGLIVKDTYQYEIRTLHNDLAEI